MTVVGRFQLQMQNNSSWKLLYRNEGGNWQSLPIELEAFLEREFRFNCLMRLAEEDEEAFINDPRGAAIMANLDKAGGSWIEQLRRAFNRLT